MTERKRLLEKLEHIKALAEKGCKGERIAAEERLNHLMGKYGITESDLEDATDRTYFIPYKTSYECKLLCQLAYMHFGAGHAHGTVGTHTKRKHKKVAIDCTPAQYIEIEADFEFYRAALAEEMDVFYSAFIQKNDLFPSPELTRDNPSSRDVDMVRIMKMEAMMEGIDHRSRRKAISTGKDEERL